MTGLSSNDRLFIAVVVLGLLAAAAWLHGCKPAQAADVANYGVALEECNRVAKTCADSISCENAVRATHGRPLRDVDAGCE